MKILVIGKGGREHALAYACKRSALCDELICAPGNTWNGKNWRMCRCERQ